MSKKQLTNRQHAVIDDLFSGKLEEAAVLKQHKVSRSLYNKWLTDPAFTEQFDQRIAGAYRRGAFEIARYAKKAAETLLTLTGSDKGETARKACIDIITMHTSIHSADSPAVSARKGASPPESSKLSPETASKLLAVLAEDKSIDKD